MLALLSEIHSGPEVWAPEPLVVEIVANVAKLSKLEDGPVPEPAVCLVAMSADLVGVFGGLYMASKIAQKKGQSSGSRH